MTEPPGPFGYSLAPLLLYSAMAPPSVFSPKAGLEPGMSWMLEIADCGIKSQFTASPNGSLMRTPSKKTEMPCGVPSSGEAVKPRKLMSG